MDNWLIKFASKQPTQMDQFRQQVESLSARDLSELVGPSPTENVDSFQEKAASAVRQGRKMAHEVGPQLIEKNARVAEEMRALSQTIGALSDDDAVKVAHIIEHGSEVEKVAVIGQLMGMAGKGLKAVGGFAAKRPGAAAAIGGAALGAMAGGEGHRLSGALMGGAAGAGAAKFIPGAKGAIQKGAFGMGLHGQNMMNKSMAGMAKAAEEVQALYKHAFACDSFGGGDPNWLVQFEGSPLLEQAIGLAEQELQMGIQEIQKAQQRQQESMSDDSWTKRDILKAHKKLLELRLVSQRNGLGQEAPDPQQPQDPQAEPSQPTPAPQQAQQQQQGVGGPGGVQMPMGQTKQAFAGIGYQIGRGLGHSQAKNKEAGAVMNFAMKHPAMAMGAMGAAGGALQGAGDSLAPGQSRSGQMARRAAVGGATGAIGGAVLKHVMKTASLPFVPRRS